MVSVVLKRFPVMVHSVFLTLSLSPSLSLSLSLYSRSLCTSLKMLVLLKSDKYIDSDQTNIMLLASLSHVLYCNRVITSS